MPSTAGRAWMPASCSDSERALTARLARENPGVPDWVGCPHSGRPGARTNKGDSMPHIASLLFVLALDLSGAWTLTIEDPLNLTYDVPLTLEQDGEWLTGMMDGTEPLTGCPGRPGARTTGVVESAHDGWGAATQHGCLGGVATPRETRARCDRQQGPPDEGHLSNLAPIVGSLRYDEDCGELVGQQERCNDRESRPLAHVRRTHGRGSRARAARRQDPEAPSSDPKHHRARQGTPQLAPSDPHDQRHADVESADAETARADRKSPAGAT